MNLLPSQVTIIFLGGFISGVSLSIVALYLYYKTIMKRKKELVAKVMNAIKGALGKNDMPDSVTKRLLQVKEITLSQQELKGIIEFPQKSAIDGKYKNKLINEVLSLEEEKNAILLSILKDGFDPIISTVDKDGAVEEMRLSAFCEIMKINETPAQAPTNTTPEEKLPPNVRKVGKFTVYSNSSDDEGTTH